MGPAVSTAVQKPFCMTKLRDALIIHTVIFLKQAFFFLTFPVINSHASSTPQHDLLCIPSRKRRTWTPDQRQAQNQQQSQSTPAPSSGLSARPKCSAPPQAPLRLPAAHTTPPETTNPCLLGSPKPAYRQQADISWGPFPTTVPTPDSTQHHLCP